MMRDFLLALQFLTIFPVKVKDVNERELSKAVIYFPVIGLLLGLTLIGANNLLCILGFGQFTVNIILIILLVILTGGLHLDGLADTADGLLSRKSKEEMLDIMRDSHVGVMGTLSLICIILLKIAFLSSIKLKPIALLLMCILSRYALVLSMFLFPYARQEGKAKVFMQGINFRILILATMITLSFVVITWQLKGLIIFMLIALASFVIGRFISKKIGGITGDALGAINEFIEVIVLFSMCILERYRFWVI